MSTKTKKRVTVGEFISDRRVEKNWSQEELAVRAGCSRATIQAIEQNRTTKASNKTLLSIREALGIPASSFPAKVVGDEVNLTISVPVTLYRLVRDASAQAGGSINGLIMSAVKNALTSQQG